ncbi:MAG: hypothetical protein IKX85_01785, partial [Clostridia bacterium]|nr:hypothetical protein [Clostridia bacterium]
MNTSGKKSDSPRLNDLVRKAAESGAGKLVIPANNPESEDGKYYLDSPIVLPSRFTLLLYNCTLVLMDGVYSNMIVSEGVFDEGLTAGDELHDIHVIGIGKATLDGGNPNDLTEKTARREGR